MLTLFHHPLCPRSRYVRLIFGEYGIPARLVEERFWERREEFLLLNPAAELPVLVASTPANDQCPLEFVVAHEGTDDDYLLLSGSDE